MNISKQNILVIAAHPDDEILGCGGMILKALKLKSKIFVLFLGEGVSARYHLNDSLGKDSIKSRKIRENEAKKNTYGLQHIQKTIRCDLLRVTTQKF